MIDAAHPSTTFTELNGFCRRSVQEEISGLELRRDPLRLAASATCGASVRGDLNG